MTEYAGERMDNMDTQVENSGAAVYEHGARATLVLTASSAQDTPLASLSARFSCREPGRMRTLVLEGVFRTAVADDGREYEAELEFVVHPAWEPGLYACDYVLLVDVHDNYSLIAAPPIEFRVSALPGETSPRLPQLKSWRFLPLPKS